MSEKPVVSKRAVTQLSTHVTLGEAKEALLRSGYLLESRVETVLNSKGYFVEANSIYPDPETGKSREYDIHAFYDYQVNENLGFVIPTLLIECVNNPQLIAFITKDQKLGYFSWEHFKLAGLPLNISLGENRWQPLPMFLHMPKYHHYGSGRIATQFCSFTRKKSQELKKGQEWMAHHDNEHFDTFRKLGVVLEHHIDKYYQYLERYGEEDGYHLYVQCFYPIVVVQGELLEVQPGKKTLRLSKTEHVKYRHSTFFKGKQASYQIDVITEEYLPKFLAVVNKEVRKTAQLLNSRHQMVKDSIDEVVKDIRQAKTPDLIREALEIDYGFE